MVSLMKNQLKSLAESFLTLLGLTASVSAAGERIHKNFLDSGWILWN